MNVHFIAIGGSAMHNLAIAMHLMGDVVSGSDDEIFEPSKGRLAAKGLLPQDLLQTLPSPWKYRFSDAQLRKDFYKSQFQQNVDLLVLGDGWLK